MTDKQKIVVNNYKCKYGAKYKKCTYMGRKGIAIFPSSGNKFIKVIREDGYDDYIGGNVYIEGGSVYINFSIQNI